MILLAEQTASAWCWYLVRVHVGSTESSIEYHGCIYVMYIEYIGRGIYVFAPRLSGNKKTKTRFVMCRDWGAVGEGMGEVGEVGEASWAGVR